MEGGSDHVSEQITQHFMTYLEAHLILLYQKTNSEVQIYGSKFQLLKVCSLSEVVFERLTVQHLEPKTLDCTCTQSRPGVISTDLL